MKGGFEFGAGQMSAVRLVAEQGMCQGAAQALVKENEEDGDLHSLVREAIGMTLAVAFQ